MKVGVHPAMKLTTEVAHDRDLKVGAQLPTLKSVEGTSFNPPSGVPASDLGRTQAAPHLSEPQLRSHASSSSFFVCLGRACGACHPKS